MGGSGTRQVAAAVVVVMGLAAVFAGQYYSVNFVASSVKRSSVTLKLVYCLCEKH